MSIATTAWAGPVPYSSIKIYLKPAIEHGGNPTPDEIRESAETVISLNEEAAVTFIRTLNFPEIVTVDKSRVLEAGTLVMVVDLYYKGQATPFTGDHASLFCSQEIAYVDSEEERYISTDHLLEVLSKCMFGK